MKFINRSVKDSALTKILTLGLAIVFAGFFTTTVSAQLSESETAKIPDGANRIVLTQEGVPPANVYVDAYKMLQRMDYKIKSSANTLEPESLQEFLGREPLVFTAKKQIDDDMAIRLSVNVKKMSGGGELVASAEYANTVDASDTDWKQAKWTDGLAKQAFSKALDTLHNAQYSAIEFETGVAVATM